MIERFPPIESADSSGLLAIGGDLEVESLILAYSQGIFPWPINQEVPLAWFAPDPRGVLMVDKVHTPRSLKKAIRQGERSGWTLKFNHQFNKIIQQCADPANRLQRDGHWLTQDMIEAYTNLHQQGLAYSLGAYQDGELIGGIYGVWMGDFVSGESMFHCQTNASKYCLISLVEIIKQRGIKWLDTQMLTPVVASLGGEEITRTTFIQMLATSFAPQGATL
ncbi:MAG: leucyl/phenylalanyl-tRNA--protein transferase [Bdellovibrionales bacterium]|nr:leucyl/phenylalanyl-tRNA--protein transferase [Bdellovibrionales bacterium]MBT3525060.1 leucyl/phenylalanyl-tRNA--protein transferase [Bdellovibrionales bacterium]MBT7767419.1 leucyl/phenylalanyl-tRNA--protein transferase [Bdellovibrionales bacterium]